MYIFTYWRFECHHFVIILLMRIAYAWNVSITSLLRRLIMWLCLTGTGNHQIHDWNRYWPRSRFSHLHQLHVEVKKLQTKIQEYWLFSSKNISHRRSLAKCQLVQTIHIKWINFNFPIDIHLINRAFNRGSVLRTSDNIHPYRPPALLIKWELNQLQKHDTYWL